MSISPNTQFYSGNIFTAVQANQFPRGIMGFASSTSNYTLTTTMTATTGMSVTFTAVASRYYKITYYEPIAETTTVSGGQTNLKIFQTSTAGTQLTSTVLQNSAALKVLGGVSAIAIISNFTAGSNTVIGAGSTTSTTGTPLLQRNLFFPSFILVEDMGPA